MEHSPAAKTREGPGAPCRLPRSQWPGPTLTSSPAQAALNRRKRQGRRRRAANLARSQWVAAYRLPEVARGGEACSPFCGDLPAESPERDSVPRGTLPASGARSSRVGGPQRRRAWGTPNRELRPHPFIAIRSTSPGARLRGRTGRLAGAPPARAPEGEPRSDPAPLLLSRGAPFRRLHRSAPVGGDVVTSRSTRHRVK